MKIMSPSDIKKSVQKEYARIAQTNGTCGCGSTECCTSFTSADPSKSAGYTDKELSSIPANSNLGLGCGNPQAIAGLAAGETVVDLGSGAGMDVFLASKAVGKTGHVIGVDMTPEMIAKARDNARMSEYGNVEFRLGEIENLPVDDNTADVIISNCVINLSAEKEKAYAEAFRALKPGGRIAIQDMIAGSEFPSELAQDMKMYSGCISGAITKSKTVSLLKKAGFEKIQIIEEPAGKMFLKSRMPQITSDTFIVPASIQAVKPN